MTRIKPEKHTWHCVNREVHGVDDIHRVDAMEEIGVALDRLSDEDFAHFMKHFDAKRYSRAFAFVGEELRKM